MRFATLATIGLALLSVPVSHGQDDPYFRRSLRGIKQLKVLVEDVSEYAEQAGITTEQLQTAVELQLRKAGATVVERFNPEALFVTVTVLRGKSGLCAVSYRLGLIQEVRLERDHTISTGGETWHAAKVGLYDSTLVREGVKLHVAELVDKFLNAYLAENPKK